jgi:hypothetical protein
MAAIVSTSNLQHVKRPPNPSPLVWYTENS